MTNNVITKDEAMAEVKRLGQELTKAEAEIEDLKNEDYMNRFYESRSQEYMISGDVGDPNGIYIERVKGGGICKCHNMEKAEMILDALSRISQEQKEWEDTSRDSTDLLNFGRRQLNTAVKLLTAYKKSPPWWLDGDVQIWFNMVSGLVYLRCDRSNIGVMRDGELDQLWTCTNCKTQGFADEMDFDCVGYCKDCNDENESEAN